MRYVDNDNHEKYYCIGVTTKFGIHEHTNKSWIFEIMRLSKLDTLFAHLSLKLRSSALSRFKHSTCGVPVVDLLIFDIDESLRVI